MSESNDGHNMRLTRRPKRRDPWDEAGDPGGGPTKEERRRRAAQKKRRAWRGVKVTFVDPSTLKKEENA